MGIPAGGRASGIVLSRIGEASTSMNKTQSLICSTSARRQNLEAEGGLPVGKCIAHERTNMSLDNTESGVRTTTNIVRTLKRIW